MRCGETAAIARRTVYTVAPELMGSGPAVGPAPLVTFDPRVPCARKRPISAAEENAPCIPQARTSTAAREHQAFRETVRKFVQTELAPRAREFDDMGRFDKSLYPKMGELGLLGIRYDPKYGGQGLDYSYQAIFLEELTLCDNAGVCHGHQRANRHGHAGAASLRQRGAEAEVSGAGDQGRARRRHRRDRAERRLRRRRHQDPRRARRRLLGDQRLEDVHHQRRHRRLAVPARRHRSRRRLRRLHADHRAHRLAGLQLPAARQDRQQGLGHRPALLRRRARAGVEHHRRRQPRLPAADDAVPGRAHGRGGHRAGRRRASCGSTRSSTASSASPSASRCRRCR